MNQYDAIVIGAGHNGLTNGAYLAKAGLKVAVLERNPYIGGATVSRELHKGWWYSNCSYVSSLLRPEITRDLELPRHGLQVVSFGGGATFMRNGDHFGNYSDHDRHYREMARHSKRDANAYDRYAADTSLQTKLIRPYLMRTPPDPTSMKPRDLRDLLEFARSFMDLGEEKLLDTIKFWTASVGDYLNEYFETDVIKAHMAGSGIIGTALGSIPPAQPTSSSTTIWVMWTAMWAPGALPEVAWAPSPIRYPKRFSPMAVRSSVTPTWMRSSLKTAGRPASH